MTKIGVIGGGAWGSTLAQVLADNGHQVLIYDINKTYVDKINGGVHPLFDSVFPETIKGTSSLEEVTSFSNLLMLAVPTKFMRSVLKDINNIITNKKVFINISKGIEPKTFETVSQIVAKEIDKEKLEGYVLLTGPSHAEEVVLRQLTLLTSVSENKELSILVQHLFANDKYLRVYTLKDVIGAEIGSAAKNAMAVISGAATGFGLGENARAALITRGIIEIIKIVKLMGGERETAFGLTGMGDLIVTASSINSRNFRAGVKLGQGMSLDEIYEGESQTIEGIRTIEALNQFAKVNEIELPMIEMAYDIIFNEVSVEDGIKKLLKRELKAEFPQ